MSAQTEYGIFGAVTEDSGSLDLHISGSGVCKANSAALADAVESFAQAVVKILESTPESSDRNRLLRQLTEFMEVTTASLLGEDDWMKSAS